MASQAKTLAALSSRRDFQARVTAECRNLQVASERCLPRRQLYFMDQIVPFDGEIRMARETDPQKKIATFPSARARFALARQANALTFMNALRDLDLITFDLVRVPAAQGNISLRTVERFFQRDHDVGLDVASAFGASLPLTERGATESRLTSAAEKRFKEIAEARATKFEIDPAAVARGVSTKPAAGLRIPARRRLKSPRLIPIRSELIVLLPFLRIAQDLVGLVDLLKLFFRGFLVFRDVGMMLARQLSKRLLDLVVGRCFRNAKGFVIISKLDCHFSPAKLCAQGRFRNHACARYLGRMRDLGRMLVIFGGVIMLVGIALWSGVGAGWLGRLPGDIRIERGNTAFYFPIVTCIIVSIVLTLVLSLFRR